MNMSASINVLVLMALIGIGGCHSETATQTAQDSSPPLPKTVSHAPSDSRLAPGIVDARPIMQAKLAQAQTVLRGIALEDFTLVKNSANALLQLSMQTDWQVHRTLPYNLFSTEFRRIMREMIRHAEARDQHAITVDYSEMTMTCVKCHSYMRHEGLAGNPIDLQPLLAGLEK